MLQDNNIENNLRELDNQQQPDLSQMDAHWQQMQAMLQPVVLPVKKGFPKWMLNTLSVGAIILLIGGAFLYLSTRKDNGNNADTSNSIAVNEKAVASVTVPVIDSTEEKADTTTPVADYKVSNEPVLYSKYFSEEDSIFSAMQIKFTPCEACPGKADTVLKPLNVNREALLKNLFVQVEKEAQKFTIDNSRDTLLLCAEGSAVLIPANSFGGKAGIVFTVKEFYKESDIILNQLSTLSNKDQLVTGGMLHIKATHNGSELSMNNQKPMVVFMPDTSNNMQGMQLFEGKEQNNTVNWIPQSQYFVKKKLLTEVRVLNIIDQPLRIVETLKGNIGYFVIDSDSLKIEKEKLRELLKEKYGYYKVKFRSSTRDWFSLRPSSEYQFSHKYGTRIGDSIWMDKKTADLYKLTYTTARVVTEESYSVVANSFLSSSLIRGENGRRANGKMDTAINNYKNYAGEYGQLFENIRNKYNVNLNQVGWINCDRFYADSRKKINYKVDLGDSAMNYYTMLVFDKINSMMTGYIDGNSIVFHNVPIDETVKVISIGINKRGETVYSVTHTTTSDKELSGLQFEATSAPDLKASLSKMDR